MNIKETELEPTCESPPVEALVRMVSGSSLSSEYCMYLRTESGFSFMSDFNFKSSSDFSFQDFSSPCSPRILVGIRHEC